MIWLPLTLALLHGCEVEPDAVVDDPVETEAPEDPCPRIPDEGKCDDNTLVLCVDGEAERTDCGLDTCMLDGDLYACVPPEPSTNPEASDVDGLSVGRSTLRADGDGLLVVPVQISGEQSFVITLTAGDGDWVAVTRLVHEDGDEPVLDRPPLSAGIYAARESSLAWPSRAEDGPLRDGLWYVVAQVGSGGFVAPRAEVEVSVAFKQDDDLDAGLLRVAVVWAGYDSGQTPAVAADAMTRAYGVWRQIYATIGVEVFIEEFVLPGVPRTGVPPGGDGTDQIADISAQTTDADVVLLVYDDFEEVPAEVVGRSGGIPGTPLAGRNAAVAVSWQRHAGIDGEFDRVEVAELGNTLAHEVGHFLGLFHPVEVTWENYDPLSDTPECTGERSCLQDLGDNLMFPVANCFTPDCTDATAISDQQAGVMHLYPGTL